MIFKSEAKAKSKGLVEYKAEPREYGESEKKEAQKGVKANDNKPSHILPLPKQAEPNAEIITTIRETARRLRAESEQAESERNEDIAEQSVFNILNFINELCETYPTREATK